MSYAAGFLLLATYGLAMLAVGWYIGRREK